MKIEVKSIASDDLNVEALFFIFFTASLLFFYIVPKEFLALFPCVFKKLTHIPCPTCGMIRTISCLMQGHVSTAFYFSFLFALLGLFSFCYAVYSGLSLIFGFRRIRISLSDRRERLLFGVILGLLIGVNWSLAIYHHL